MQRTMIVTILLAGLTVTIYVAQLGVAIGVAKFAFDTCCDVVSWVYSHNG